MKRVESDCGLLLNEPSDLSNLQWVTRELETPSTEVEPWW